MRQLLFNEVKPFSQDFIKQGSCRSPDSGESSWGAAGVNGFGSINSYMIEQSNVDLAKEMVHMITTQRGFQSNSKVITTTDIMLETVVNMKR